MATDKIPVTAGSGTNTATYSGTEDAVTKHTGRVVLNNSSFTEIATSSNPLQVSLANTAANSTAVKVDGSAVTQPVSAASLPLPSGAATAAKQPALGTAGTASADVITIQGISSMTKLLVTPDANSAVNVAQINGVTPLMGAGNGGTGSLRVNVATDQVAIPVSESGTWTVQPGNTANSTPWLVTTIPSTTGGWTPSLQNALTTSVATVKGSAGTLGGWFLYNPNSVVGYIQIFDISGAVTLGTSVPVLSIAMPPGSAANIEIAIGINFANAIKVAATTTATGSTALTTATDCNFWYK